MKKIIVALCMLVLLSGCASSQFRPGPGSYGDAATTVYALESGNFVEANPVFAWIENPMGIAVASIGMKWGAKHALHDGLGIDAYTSDTLVETAGVGIGLGWNPALILGASNPVGAVVALGAGWLYYEYRMRNRWDERYDYLNYEIDVEAVE